MEGSVSQTKLWKSPLMVGLGEVVVASSVFCPQAPVLMTSKAMAGIIRMLRKPVGRVRMVLTVVGALCGMWTVCAKTQALGYDAGHGC